MIINNIQSFLVRELEKLKLEISLYEREEFIWMVAGDISNSAGHLCLHLCGNLQHFIGAVLGNTGYLRQRDLEFSSAPVNRENLIALIDQTIVVVQQTLHKMDDSIISETYPLKKHEEQVTMLHMLNHLLTHLNYHLGQVNYHRRLMVILRNK